MFLVGIFLYQQSHADCGLLFYKGIPTKSEITSGQIQDYSKDSKLILFRVIGHDYKKQHVPEGSFAEKEGTYAYSLSPSIPLYWASQLSEANKKIILISVQDIYKDNLLYPKNLNVLEGHLENYVPLTLQTSIQEIAMLNEIRVPFDKENVQIILSYEDFLKIIENSEEYIDPFEFIEKLIRYFDF